MQPLPVELCFPAPPSLPARPAKVPAAETELFLRQVGEWRRAVIAWITLTDPGERRQQDGLTERACLALVTFLQVEWKPGMQAYAAHGPYNISPFPAQVLDLAGTVPPDAVMEILRWRAGVTDYLGDVYDVIGEPALDLDECSAIEAFLTPSRSQSHCHLCLQSFPKAQTHPDAHCCAVLGHVRAKWPALPPVVARWAEEARQKQAPANSMTAPPGEPKPTRPKWWQFWK